MNIHKTIQTLTIAFLGSLFAACTTTSANAPEELEKKKFAPENATVDAIILKESTFEKQLLSNGKLKAHKKCELQFELTGKLQKVYVKNGAKIHAKSTVATLDQQETTQQHKQAELQLKKSELDRQELLISQGYDPKNTTTIPPKVLETANIRSGYSGALNNLEQAKFNLAKHKLVSPISGKVANLKLKTYEYAQAGKTFCSVIDDTKFEVEFNVLEAELQDIHKGQSVEIKPFSTIESFLGKVTEINPVIDENGMIGVKALIKNTGYLMEGMNVEVKVKKNIENQLIVPKAALVIRQDKEVIFRIKSGKAYWTYVHSVYKNAEQNTVVANTDRGATLQAGDTVIISNNLSLAHESLVSVVNIKAIM